MEPSSDSDSRNNRIWFSSREPDIHEVVNPSDLLNRVNRRPKKNRPLLIGLGKLVAGRTAIFKIQKLKTILEVLSCPYETNRHGRRHGFNWKRLSLTMRACINCKSKSQTMFVKRSTVTRQNLMS